MIKYNMKQGILLAIGGSLIYGAFFYLGSGFFLKLIGLLFALLGMTTIGLRSYEKIKDKRAIVA